MSGEKMSTRELTDRLRRHYIKPGEALPGGVFLPEVTLGSRRADALYIGFTSTRGRHLIGHEVKVSRADWMHELDQAHKAEEWERECHAWYVVAPSTDIVRPEELPPGWGLMVVLPTTRTRLHIVVKAEHHPERQPSWRAVHELLKKQDTLRAAGIEEARKKAYQDGYDARVRIEEDGSTAAMLTKARQELDEARAALDAVSEIVGVRIVAGDRAWPDQLTAQDFGEQWRTFLALNREVAGLQRSVQKRARMMMSDAEHLLSIARRFHEKAGDAL